MPFGSFDSLAEGARAASLGAHGTLGYINVTRPNPWDITPIGWYKTIIYNAWKQIEHLS